MDISGWNQSIAHLNGNLLIQRGDNYLFYTAQDHDFLVATHDVSKHHSTQQYIHTEDQVISINDGNALMHVIFQELMHQDFDNLSHIILTFNHPSEPATINNESEVKFLPLNYDEISDDFQISADKTVYEQDKVKPVINTKYIVEGKFRSSTHLDSNIICLPLGRYFKSHSPFQNTTLVQ